MRESPGEKAAGHPIREGRCIRHAAGVRAQQLHPVTVFIAEDSDLDFSLLNHALAHSHANLLVHRATDGQVAIDYLKGGEQYADRALYPFPNVVMVDLKMPRVSGFDVLEWIRDNPGYRVIPTVVMSTSAEPADVQRAYELGANTYFRKPAGLADLVALCTHLAEYWARAEIPRRS